LSQWQGADWHRLSLVKFQLLEGYHLFCLFYLSVVNLQRFNPLGCLWKRSVSSTVPCKLPQPLCQPEPGEVITLPTQEALTYHKDLWEISQLPVKSPCRNVPAPWLTFS
jgi:hypothetical protein